MILSSKKSKLCPQDLEALKNWLPEIDVELVSNFKIKLNMLQIFILMVNTVWYGYHRYWYLLDKHKIVGLKRVSLSTGMRRPIKKKVSKHLIFISELRFVSG